MSNGITEDLWRNESRGRRAILFPSTTSLAEESVSRTSHRFDHGEESYEGSGLLDGRVALIAGGDRGIGRAVAIAFAREGADIAVGYSHRQKEAEDTANLVNRAGRRSITIGGDIRDAAFCRKMVDVTVDRLGRLDILINNTCYMSGSGPFELTSDSLERPERTRFAPFFLCREAIPYLRPGALIINTTDAVEIEGDRAYAAKREALGGFTKSLAQLLVKKGVRVNGVAPAPTWSALVPGMLQSDQIEELTEQTTMSQPAELAHLFVFLASENASYVSGEVYGASAGEIPVY